MSHTIVIYKSVYGSTQQYAEWIAQDLGCALSSVTNMAEVNFSLYNRVIFGSSVQNSQLTGIRYLKIIASAHPEMDITAFSVGVGDPKNRSYTQTIENQFFPEVGRNIGLYHLRGSFDVSKLNFIDRYRVRRLYNIANAVPVEERSYMQQAMVSFYEEPVSFQTRDSIWPLLGDLSRPL